jgi:hypothetical protein
MTTVEQHLITLISEQRQQLLQKSTDIAFASGLAITDKASVEQMLNAVILILEEYLRGEGKEIRTMFLETAMPAVVESGTSSWGDMLRDGLPCWGILIGQLSVSAEEPFRVAAIERLSRIMGEWWLDVSNVVLPLYKARGEL